MSGLSESLSVFNHHINNAHNRVMSHLEQHFPDQFNEMKDHDEHSIMSIFKIEPTDATRRYVALVHFLVNQPEEKVSESVLKSVQANSIIEAILEEKTKIALSRDKLREIIETAEAICDDSKEAVESLENSVQVLSRYL